MLILKIAGLIAVGAAAGLVTATGLFALISSIGLINRYADVTDTKEHIMLYEEMIIIGAGPQPRDHLPPAERIAVG